MSKETLDLMLGLNRSELETQIALQCAPVLTGVKISNLLTVKLQYKGQVMELFQGMAVAWYVLYESREEDKITFLIYFEKKLSDYLQESDVSRLMEHFGCQNTSLTRILQAVSGRYSAHMEGQGTFPHEIGLLLGYPPEDVMGFIENKGQNFLYKGYWKVYSNPSQRIRIFEDYSRARDTMIHLLSKGACIRSVMKLYNLHTYKSMAI